MNPYTLADRYGMRRFLAASDEEAIKLLLQRLDKLGWREGVLMRDSDNTVIADYQEG